MDERNFIRRMADKIIELPAWKKVLLGTIVVAGGAGLGACGKAILDPTPTSKKPTTTPGPTNTEPIIITPSNEPVGPKGTETPEAVIRPYVSKEQTANLTPSLKLSTDEEGNLIGLPSNASKDLYDSAKTKYIALREFANSGFGLSPDELLTNGITEKDIAGAQIYFDQASTGEWTEYALLGDGRLMWNAVQYQSGGGQLGPFQFADYPTNFVNFTSGKYFPVDIPGGSMAIAWVRAANGTEYPGKSRAIGT